MTFITKSYQNLFGVRSYINAKDYELLPDTIINALNDGNRVLLINKFHFYRN